MSLSVADKVALVLMSIGGCVMTADACAIAKVEQLARAEQPPPTLPESEQVCK